MPTNDYATYALQAGFNEIVSGVFYIETSSLSGIDGLSDLGLFAGTLDDISADLEGAVTIETGTDSLIGSVQASSLTAHVARVDNPGYWNPNNPASPLNLVTPGFVPARPVRYQGTQDATTYGLFYGFLVRATWNIRTRSCELYCEDLLKWCSRVYPVITSTGPTTTGAAVGKILDAVGWTGASLRSLSTGDSIADFSADGSQTALELIAALLEAERGTVYVRGDGVVVYESRDKVQARTASATLNVKTNLDTLESSIDLDKIFTRVTVTRVDPVNGNFTFTAIDATGEMQYGRGELPAISSPYIPSNAAVTALAQDLIYDGVRGKPPIVATAINADATTLQAMLASPLLTVFSITDVVGGTVGNLVVQRAVHTIEKRRHEVEYTMAKRLASVFYLDTVGGSALDGTDPLRY